MLETEPFVVFVLIASQVKVLLANGTEHFVVAFGVGKDHQLIYFVQFLHLFYFFDLFLKHLSVSLLYFVFVLRQPVQPQIVFIDEPFNRDDTRVFLWLLLLLLFSLQHHLDAKRGNKVYRLS